MLNRVLFDKKNFQILFCIILSIFNLFYFLHKYSVNTAIDDAFYDADAARTLSYVSDPNNAVSSIRPFLFLIAWLPHLMSKLLSPYAAWVLLNAACLFYLVWRISRYLARSKSHFIYTALLFLNFSTLSWTVVPDTFLLGAAFFMLAIFVYGDGSKRWAVILSGIFASGFNLFLLVPWTIAHTYLTRKTFLKGVISSIKVNLIMAILALTAQYFSTFNADSRTVGTNSHLNPDEKQEVVTIPIGILESVDSLGWIHSPFPGIIENLILFLCSPWTVGYHYLSSSIAINSVFFSFAVLVLAAGLSLFSFFGIYRMRIGFRRFSVFCLGLEIGTCLLFLIYGFHPVLFSPFLLITRLPGLAFLIIDGGKHVYQIFLTVNIVTFTTIYLVF